MPTFTAVSLERLLEASVRNSLSLKQDINQNKGDSDAKKPPPKHIYISPALYATPEPAPIPDSSSGSISPSPYVVNRKRRDFRVPEAVKWRDESEIRENEMKQMCVDVPFVQLEEENDASLSLLDVEIVEGKEDDPRESVSVAIICRKTDNLRQLAGKNTPPMLSQSEFYDADEDFSSNGSISNASPSLHPNIESELRAARVNLFEEIERRKRAEDALGQMRNQWERISNLLSQGGLSFPATWDARNNTQLRMDSAEQFCQEVVLARFVSKAIGKGEARAETEAAAEAVIKSKNQEISRLRDRLQYYETVNHEMSHRNQEAMEIARRQRHLRKTRQSRIWSFIGLSVAIGASVLACSYLPQTSKHPLMTSNDFSDASSSLQESGNVNPGLIW